MSISFSWFKSLDLYIYDFAQRFVAFDLADDILIVEIDEQSIDAIGAWPWPRNFHAQLVERLSSMGAKAVAFDVIFSEPNTTNAYADELFATQMERAGNVILPVYIEQLRHNGQVVEAPPANIFYKVSASVGHVHIECDFDGVCRSVYLKQGVGRPYWPHLSLSVLNFLADLEGGSSSDAGGESISTAELAGAQAPPKTLLTDGETGRQTIVRDFLNYIPFSTHGRFETISYVDVLTQKIPAKLVRDKVVFVGATAPRMGDLIMTPVGTVSGVEVNAGIFQALRQQRFINRASELVQFLLSCALTFVFLLSLARATPFQFLVGTILGVIFLVASCVLSLVVFAFWFPVAPLIVSLLFFYPLWNWLKLQLALRFLKQALAKLDVEKKAEEYSLVRSQKGVGLNQKQSTPVSGVEVVTNTLNRLTEVGDIVEENRRLIQETLARLSEAVVLTDISGGILLANARAKRVFSDLDDNISCIGERLTMTHQKQWNEFFAGIVQGVSEAPIELSLPPFPSDVAEGDVSLVSSQSQEEDLVLLCRGLSATIDDSEYHQTTLIFTFTDITLLKKIERSRLDTLNFLSHDLRSPMVSLLALVANIQSGRSSDSREQSLEKIKNYAQKNLSFSESLIQLSRAEGISEESFSPIDMHAVIDGAVFNIAEYAKSMNVDIQLRRPDDDFWVYGDYDLLERALTNLLSNAIKYSDGANNINLALSESRSLSGAAMVEIAVEDSGRGIPRSDVDVLFQRYRRAKNKGRQSGAGLGLFFVREVAGKHMGSVSVTSEEGLGSVFTLTLPILAEPYV